MANFSFSGNTCFGIFNHCSFKENIYFSDFRIVLLRYLAFSASSQFSFVGCQGNQHCLRVVLGPKLTVFASNFNGSRVRAAINIQEAW